MTGKSEGEKFVEIFVDTIKVNTEYVATREDLRSSAHMARLATDSVAVQEEEEEAEEKEEEILALTKKIDTFKTQRIAELTGLVDGRLVTVRDLSPTGMPSSILLTDSRRRLDIVTGQDVKIMNNVSGFTGTVIPNDMEIDALTDGPDNRPEVLHTELFQVDHMVYVNRVNRENNFIPRVSVDIHEA